MATGGVLNPAGMFRAIPLQILEKIFPVAKNILSELFIEFVEKTLTIQLKIYALPIILDL